MLRRQTVNKLSTYQLSISYGENAVIEDLDIQIPEGKITILVGSNG